MDSFGAKRIGLNRVVLEEKRLPDCGEVNSAEDAGDLSEVCLLALATHSLVWPPKPSSRKPDY
jgi:hypothetical protein